jgi:hypothetical protein
VSWVIVLNYASHDVAWDATDRLAYISVPDCRNYGPLHPCLGYSAVQFESRVWSTDPNDGWLRDELLHIPNPGRIAAGGDGMYVFALLPFWGMHRVDVRVPEIRGVWRGIPQTDLEAVPGWPGAHVIAGAEGLRIRTDTTLASDVTDPFYELAVSADHVFAFENENGSDALVRASVTPQGLVHDTTVFGALTGTGLEIDYGLGRIFAGDGTVLDATTLVPVGSIAASGSLHVETAENRVYFFDAGQVTVADATTLQVLATFDVPQAVDLRRIVRWGTNGLGFADGPAVVFIRSPLVPG